MNTVLDGVAAHVAPPTTAQRRATAGGLAIVRDPLRLMLFVLTVLIISRVHQHYPILAKLRPALLMVLGSAAYAWLNPTVLARSGVLRTWPMRRVAVLAALACCSAVFGISLGRSGSFLLTSYGKTVIYAFLMAMAIRHARDLYTFVWAYAVSCGILAFFSLFVFGLTKASNSYAARLSDLYTYDANDLGVVMLVGIALTMLLLTVSRGATRVVLLVNVLCMVATIARSGSRGAFVGVVVLSAAAMLLVDVVSAGKKTGVAIAVVAALAVGAPPGYWQQMGTVLEPKADYNYSSTDGRRALMQRGIGYMIAYPVFGLGIDNFMRAECTVSVKIETLGNARLRCTPPHNSYVQAGAELGVPGLLVWGSIIVGGVLGLLRLRGRLPRSWRRGTDEQRFLHAATSFMPLALIGFAVTAFFVSFAWMDVIYLLAALMTGLYTAIAVCAAGERGRAVVPVAAVRGSREWRMHGSGDPQRRRATWRPS
jgi:O-Antigen ligase